MTCLKSHSRTCFLPTGHRFVLLCFYKSKSKLAEKSIGLKYRKIPYSANPSENLLGPKRVTKEKAFYCLKGRYRDPDGFLMECMGPSLDLVGGRGIAVVKLQGRPSTHLSPCRSMNSFH